MGGPAAGASSLRTAESDERDTRTLAPTRVEGRRPSAIQRWTVLTVTPSSSATCRGVRSSLMSRLSQGAQVPVNILPICNQSSYEFDPLVPRP